MGRMKELYMMYNNDELSIEEISKRLGVSENAIGKLVLDTPRAISIILDLNSKGHTKESIASMFNVTTLDIREILYPSGCEHDNNYLIDEIVEIVENNNLRTTQWYECGCGSKGTREYIIPSNINWSEEEC